jgi:tetratricopeptide (TPR) repeat protein
MDEKTFLKLIDFVEQTTDAAVVQTSMDECFDALRWAEQKQRWDLIIELTYTLSSYFIHSRAVDLKIEKQGPEQIEAAMRNFWEQGRECFRRGLMAAKQANQDEVPFLARLSRLSSYLGEFDVALDYLKHELKLIHPEMKWRTIREIKLLGTQAVGEGKFLIARECYQTSLNELEKMGNKYGMAETLDWMAANEDSLGNFDVAKQLFDQSDEIRKEVALEKNSNS